MRVRLDLSYDGTDFAGWAMQPSLRTVEDTLAEALARVLRLREVPRLVVAGRTDAGVHARGQVCHVDLPAAAWEATPARSGVPPSRALIRRLAGVLPKDLRVQRVGLAAPGFDARYSALRRRYAYRVSESEAGLDPLRRHEVLSHRRPLDLAAISSASALLLGLHDFAAFCRLREGATTVRTLQEFSWRRRHEGEPDAGLVVATVVADAFCRSMVRALVGAVLRVGEHRRAVDWPARVLAGGVRDSRVTVAPARGLTLERVDYPPDDQLAARATEARVRRYLP